MFAFSGGDLPTSVSLLEGILSEAPDYLDAHLALGMAYLRLGDVQAAIAQGHRAEALFPDEQLVHTNLSLFYLKSGDKAAAERHGLKARIASWKTTPSAGTPPASMGDGSLAQTTPPPSPVKVRRMPPLPPQPWKQGGATADPHPHPGPDPAP